ncbi:MAG: hypothetical protein IT214_14025 [Chitinophagaceae bacterium]|nr:hypothetical protein [Chitinophagaceae bacterium]
MQKYILLLFLLGFAKSQAVFCQTYQFDKISFFEDTSLINATLTTDLVHLERQRNKEGKQYPGHFLISLPGDNILDAPVILELRGHIRKVICDIPPIKINFKSQKNSELHKLGSLKMVNQCKVSKTYEDYLIREYLIYKMYNLITDASFRVRLMKLTLTDSSNNKKPQPEYAFLVEDVKDLAKRNKCRELSNAKVDPRETDRRQMTIVAIFEYMIGNTDWGISVNHNTRLIIPATDSVSRPFVIPYDFDYSGLVNADYAVPDENLGIANVRERLYRGFPRTMEELNEVLGIFKKQKDAIYDLIKNCGMLSSSSKKDMTRYLDPFFETINDPYSVKDIFINSARNN